MTKKIIVMTYKPDGQLAFKMTLTARKGIDASDFKSMQREVMKLIQGQIVGEKWYSVEWLRDGFVEGFAVKR